MLAATLMMGAASVAFAMPVDPAGALAAVADFLGTPPPAMRRAVPASQGTLDIAYTGYSQSGVRGIYVVNSDSGYVVVSADDALPQIVGFSDNGKFDPNNIPPNMKWWLDDLAEQVGHFTKANPAAPKRVQRRAATREAIAPMADYLWDQTAPYNDQCPIDSRTGRRSVTGCVATAMSILMKYHNWPPKAKGSTAGYIFEGEAFDWDKMIRSYEQGKYSKEQAEAVAKLMHLAGEAVEMMYSSQESGAYSLLVSRALIENFDYNPSMKYYWKDYVRQMEWNDIVYKELAEKRPVYYAGRSSRGGHAFVCDGYLANEYFHFNWGWGGYQNGYFLLYLLNPEAGGTGSYEGGYNSGQNIITGLCPNAGQKGQQAALLATGSFSYSGGSWAITDDPYGENLIYNPLYNNQSVTFLQRVVKASDGSLLGDYASETKSMPSVLQGMAVAGFKNTVPTNLPDGEYHVYPYFKCGSAVEPIQIPLGKQQYVTLTVKGGKNTFTNQGISTNEAPNLVFGRPLPAAPLNTADNKSFRLTISNTGLGDYRGTIGITLYNPDDAMTTYLSATENCPIPGRSSTNLILQSNEMLKPGKYLCQVLDEEDIYSSETYWYEIPEGVSHADASSPLKAFNVTPAFYTVGEERAVSLSVKNPEMYKNVDAKFKFVLKRASDNKEMWSNEAGQLTVPGGFDSRVNTRPVKFDLTPGQYYWEVYINDLLASERNPMVVWSKPQTSAEGLTYVITDETAKTAIVTAPSLKQYSGNVTIPAKIGDYTITDITADAFTFAAGLRSLSINANLPRIEDGTFYAATGLRALDLSGAPLNAPTLHEKAFSPDTQSLILLTVPKGMPNVYAQQDTWTALKLGAWDINIANGVTIESGLEIDPVTGTYFSPYYTNPLEALSLMVSAPAGKYVKAQYEFDGETVEKTTGESKDLLWIPALHGSKGTLSLTLSDVSSVDEMSGETHRADIYNAQGVLIMRQATKADLQQLPAGIYIHGTRKHIIR